MIQLSTLTENPKNARAISDEHFAALRKSVASRPWMFPIRPIVARRADGVVLGGTEADSDNVVKLARARKFWQASGPVRLATLEKYFDLQRLFGAFTPETLPTRNIGTYCAVEKMWCRTKLEAAP